MENLSTTLTKVLKKNSFKVVVKDQEIRFSSSYLPSILVLIGVIIGICFFIFVFPINLLIGLLGIILALILVLYETLKFPRKIVLQLKTKTLVLKKNFWLKNHIPFLDVDDLVAERVIHNTSASPFKESNKKYVYRFFIKNKMGKEFKVIRMDSFTNIDDPMKEMAAFLNGVIGR